MILITLIENSFKHGVMPAVETAWIDLSLVVDDEWINIVLRNSHKSNYSRVGVGLDNLLNQLDLIYKDSYDLKINRRDLEHEVKLKLMIK